MGINLRVAQQYRNEKGKLPKETDGDWMRHIDFEALDEHVNETIKYTRKVSETLTKQGE